MHTEVTLKPEVVKAVEKFQKQQGLGFNEAVNSLVENGLPEDFQKSERPFRQRTANLGAKMDVTNIGEVFEVLER